MAWMLGSCFLTVAKYRLCCTTVEWYSITLEQTQVVFYHFFLSPGELTSIVYYTDGPALLCRMIHYNLTGTYEYRLSYIHKMARRSG